MSFEAIASIAKAEEAARQAVLDAETEARKLIAEAEADGKAAVNAALKSAEEQLSSRKIASEAKSAEQLSKLSEETENEKAALRKAAEARLEAAAALVVERIVNV